MIRSLVKKIYLAGSTLMLTFLGYTRIYLVWSELYRRLFHRKYAEVSVKRSVSIKEALEAMRLLTWTRDGKRELFDAVGHPGWVQHCIEEVRAGREQPGGALDCDEFAVWAAAVLDKKRRPLVYQQTWCDKNGFALGGHHVCVFRDWTTERLFHIGNWGYLGPFDNLEELGKQMCEVMNAVPLSWAIFTPDLRYGNSGANLPRKTTYAHVAKKLIHPQ